MKKLFKLLTLIAFGAGITWLLRDQLVPGPTAPTAHPPPFRHAPEPPDHHTDSKHADTKHADTKHADTKHADSKLDADRAAADPAEDDLTEVNGIGPVYAGKLTAAGVATFRELAGADADNLAAATGLPRERVADWIGKAADLA